MEELEIGDVIYLKSGSKPMTVVALNRDVMGDVTSVDVVWMDDIGVMHSSSIRVDAVTKKQESAYYVRYASNNEFRG